MRPAQQWRATRLSVVGALAICTALFTEPSHAELRDYQARSAARLLADQAADSFARGNYVHANELLQRAYELIPAPTIAVLQARTLVRLKRFVEATEVYNRALRTPLTPDSPEAFRQAVQQADTELAALLPRVPKLKIMVRGASMNHPDLEVHFDGEPLPRALVGAWMPVDPTLHSVRAVLDGDEGVPVRVALQEGVNTVTTVEVPVKTPARTPGIISLGLGATGIGIGIATGMVAMNAHEDAEGACANAGCVEGTPGADALERFRTYRTISTVGYALGAVGVGLGVFLVLRASKDGTSSVAVLPTTQGLRVEGRL